MSDDQLVDGINLPLDDEQIRALAAGHIVRIDIPAEPALGSERTTVVILRRKRGAGAPLVAHGVHDTEVGKGLV